jgi:hypothetical protein
MMWVADGTEGIGEGNVMGSRICPLIDSGNGEDDDVFNRFGGRGFVIAVKSKKV